MAFQSYLTAPFLLRQLNALEYSFAGKIIGDAGTGLGILPCLLKDKNPLKIVGIDLDRSFLKTAGNLTHSENTAYINADIRRMPLKDNIFDAIFARYVFQHLNLSNIFLSEIKRTMKDGGLLVIADIEDDLTVYYPEPPDSSKKLFAAYSNYQMLSGGDRLISKKLPAFLSSVGFNDIKIKNFAQTFFKNGRVSDCAETLKNAFLLLQNELELVKENFFKEKLITPTEYHRGLNDYYKFLISEDYIFISKTDFLITCVK